jgi:glycosyltransferase involved in cell wall biosynthesis
MKISIIIPAYEAKGRAVELMSELFDSISNQTYKDYEIIVADHSLDVEIENLCKKYNLNINHFYNDRGRGNSSINMNEGIKRATGDVIKVMHMDDVMINPHTLEHIAKGLEGNPNSMWGAVVFNHNYETGKNPGIRRVIVPSIDTVIGCPSVSFFRLNKDNPELFDENLIILNDHDMHQRLNKKYGLPIIIGDEKKIYITIRMHDEQVSGWIGREKEQQEIEYLKLKLQ